MSIIEVSGDGYSVSQLKYINIEYIIDITITVLRASSFTILHQFPCLEGSLANLKDHNSQGNDFVVKNYMGTTLLIRKMVVQLYYANINEDSPWRSDMPVKEDGEKETILLEYHLLISNFMT